MKDAERNENEKPNLVPITEGLKKLGL